MGCVVFETTKVKFQSSFISLTSRQANGSSKVLVVYLEE